MRTAALLLTPLFVFAQTASDSPVDRNRERIIKAVRKEILTLPFYGPLTGSPFS